MDASVGLIIAAVVMLVLLAVGLPVGFTFGAAAMLGFLLIEGPQSLVILVINTWAYMNAYLFVAQ